MKYKIVNNDYCETLDIKERVLRYLNKNNHIEDDENYEFIIIIGGDGTLLKALKENAEAILNNVKFIAIKSGSLGFYNLFNEKEFYQWIDNNLNNYKYWEYDLLDVKVDNKRFYALNEVKIIDQIKTLRLDVYINKDHLQLFRGSGLVFSTKTGSTGYMKSINGAIILSKLELWEMNEIAPLSNNKFRTINSPIILDNTKVVNIEKELIGKTLIIDTVPYEIKKDFIEIKISNYKLNMIKNPYYKVSQVKLIKNKFFINKTVKKQCPDK